MKNKNIQKNAPARIWTGELSITSAEFLPLD